MEFKDRVAENPNRVKIIYEDSGASVYANIELADNAIQEGTPLNKKTFDDFSDELHNYADSKNFVGSVVITSTNTNPSTELGGTWELIDKEFSSKSLIDEGSGSLFTTEGSPAEISKYGVYAIYGGHTIRLRLDFTTDVGIESDDTIDFGQLVLNNIGVNSFHHSILSIPMMSDASNGLLIGNIANDGKVYVNDAIKFTTAGPIIMSASIVCKFDNMIDSFCDKFYWKRTK